MLPFPHFPGFFDPLQQALLSEPIFPFADSSPQIMARFLGNILYGDLHVFAKLCQHGGDPFSMWRQGDDGASLVLLVFKAFHQPSCRHFSNDIAHGWMTVPYFLRYARYCFLFPVGQNEKQGKPLWPYVNAV